VAGTIVNVRLEVTDGELVACAVIVTVLPFGISEGAVYEVTIVAVVG
jgi:hypothetical protein